MSRCNLVSAQTSNVYITHHVALNPTSSSLASLACYLLPNCTCFSVCSNGRSLIFWFVQFRLVSENWIGILEWPKLL